MKRTLSRFKDSYKMNIINSSRFGGVDYANYCIMSVTVTDNQEFVLATVGVSEISIDWGDDSSEISTIDNPTHTYVTAGTYFIQISGSLDKFYFNNSTQASSVTSIVQFGDLNYSTDQERAFFGCSLSSLPSAELDLNFYNQIENGYVTFALNQITSLPEGMVLGNVTMGRSMFNGNLLTSLPLNMTLASLIDGRYMFENNSLTSLPTVMTLASLAYGFKMFNGSSIVTADYSQLLVNMATYNTNTSVSFYGGSSTYNTTGETSRTYLTGTLLWTIIDGGLA